MWAPFRCLFLFFFFFNDTATTEIYTLSLHDALPIYNDFLTHWGLSLMVFLPTAGRSEEHTFELQSRVDISYAVFCLKKKTQKKQIYLTTKMKISLTSITLGESD